MNTLARLLAPLLVATLAPLSLTACALQEPTPETAGPRPDYKPPIAMESDGGPTPSIHESLEIGSPTSRDPRVDDGRAMWVEVLESDGHRTTELHHFDSETGIDLIEILDEDGLVLRTIETRYHAASIPVEDRH